MLGNAIDAEANGQPDPAALGDDNNGATPDDEDGVTFTTSLVQGQQACVDVHAYHAPRRKRLPRCLARFRRQRPWEHPAEQIFAGLPLMPGNEPWPLLPSAGRMPCRD